MKKPVFKGIGTAIVTPMRENGDLDFEALGRLLELQIQGGVNAIIACGTTGESATLTIEEHHEVLKFVVEHVAGRVPVIAGTGSNCTRSAINMTRFANEIGADACLCVTPYYNKATQAGLIANFRAIADASRIPIILYNVPSRTSTNLLPETVAALADHENIAAIKEASGNISQIADTISKTAGRMAVYSGNDDQIVPIMALGGIGCISVLSNVAPQLAVDICRKMEAGDVAGAAALQLEALPLIHGLFSQVNPIPVKAALAEMGLISNGIRLPLTPMEAPQKQVLLAQMKKWGLV